MFELSALGSLVEKQQGGGTPPRSDPAFWNGGIPWASVKDFKDDQLELQATEETITSLGLRSSTSSLIPPGTPMVCTRMAVGRCAISALPTAINQDVRALYPKKGVSPRYLLRLVASLQGKAESLSVGSTVKGIRSSDFLAIKTHVAPENEQSVIADILNTLDTQIQKTEALIAKLEKVKEGLLHDLLTRGIDESGRLRPSPEQAPELYKESPLGLIPREWSVSTLGERLSQYGGFIQTGPFGSQLHAEEYVREGVPVVMPQDMRDIEVSKENIAQITEERAEDLARHRVGEGDLLFSRRGDLSRCSFMSSSNKGWLCGTGCLLLRPVEHIDGFWLANIYKLSAIQSQVYGMAVGSTMVNLNSTILKNIVIPFPAFQEQSKIAEAIKSSKNKIFEEINILSKLKLQKIGLIDDLLTGRVRVTPLLDQAQATTPA
ncbi:hypothetical protein HME01_16120 [Vreelandella aquamarina]|jgi:type I restriction enzyme S subunit|uniref:Type I restriction enzyme, S subunit n=1 Tax=Vreelandella aquamarina TaxID=77097 RepID=A0A1N6DQX6_9GAMM|nr:restriction endonuclease subunit S [Halomonas meridiana]GED45760.1 hypothetical protein HME01_16120 [Halomonas meridiana]SIN64022.1 type I restriction enzyme, S subunit [Halomonas meridiana]SIN73166.1 type I restriction enzyme, S subunit [Halomonas meridiana]SIO41068.1 type I restriction enzyme, S subunit [Halomonas meridiana]